ncbi:MAG: UbiD family decarboxylase [Desulfovibrio sp.]|jgi:4-hydroxy-3-polyprenylbenzoate decarboxylase|nr:UbiD family decarboxylase [Desulfovibrio sp.]
MKNIDSLREYIQTLEKQKLLLEIDTEVDCHLELGAVMKKSNDMKGPALLFNKLKGFPKGFRVLGSPVSAFYKPGLMYARIAVSMGLAPGTGVLEIIDKLSAIADLPPIKPVIVGESPCKENKLLGEDVDLSVLPAPLLHSGDGGDYLGTWPIVITKSSDGKWVNWGMYRVMVHDKKTLGAPLIPTQHIGMHYATWKEINEPMPFAIAFGTDPLTPIIASMAIPPYVSEADVVGGYREKPVELVKCETVDLSVPASSEIVIEGTVSMDDSRLEGPFTEYTGFLLKARKSWPVFNVSAITYRNNPIMPVVCTGEPVEDHLTMSVSLAAGALNLLRKAGLPVKGAFIPAVSALHLLVISVCKDRFSGTDEELVNAVAKTVWSDKVGTFTPKIMIVDDDIDITDLDAVVWSFSTRCHPGAGFHFFPDTTIVPLSPYLAPEEKKAAKTTNVVYDCTWSSKLAKEDIPVRATLEALWPAEVRSKLQNNWRRYGFEG